MTGQTKLMAAMIVLFCAAIIVPLVLQGVPLPLRLLAGFSNFVAGTAIALLLWQRRGRGPSTSSKDNASSR